MPSKIVCPFHQVEGKPEKTPSLALYSDHYYCFSCRAHGPLENLPGGVKVKATPKKKENIRLSLRRISTLPTKKIRGHILPYDENYYYLVFPGEQYYKKRAFNTAGKAAKYICPPGQRQPLYWARRTTGNDTLYIVEGELNALSFSLVEKDSDIVSPGAASELASKRHFSNYKRYRKIRLVVDNDRAGRQAAVELFRELAGNVDEFTWNLVSEDFNRTLQRDGLEGLQRTVREGQKMAGKE